jgi:hypothetical protein
LAVNPSWQCPPGYSKASSGWWDDAPLTAQIWFSVENDNNGIRAANYILCGLVA